MNAKCMCGGMPGVVSDVKDSLVSIVLTLPATNKSLY